eukprot:3273785-Pleurochrysis_carterae.AAC.1
MKPVVARQLRGAHPDAWPDQLRGGTGRCGDGVDIVHAHGLLQRLEKLVPVPDVAPHEDVVVLGRH